MNYRLGLIGFPISHSLSPWIHNMFLKNADQQGTYKTFEIIPEEFESTLNDIRKEEELDGFNVTIPFKQKIIPYLDEIDQYASAVGAVNTVKNINGKWVGYNTDGLGYIQSLKEKFPQLFRNKGIRVALVGAGGAARGIYFALMTNGFRRIDVGNRTLEHAMDLNLLSTPETITNIISLHELEKVITDYDLIIQTTNVGMKPNSDSSILSFSKLRHSQVVSDIVYQPLKTQLLRQAEEKGASILCGHSMLIYQAKAAFEIWTGREVDNIKEMEKQLQNILEG
ncbi:shikimate dehydrogenase [Oceanobacillus limi]|uniref:Shikimate dehydrogenase (NADP(+)) n=1 Tax=Oceanobacillus limi TaxID=930131 RepID=A0A1I0FU59_9BACI|nr:shikimate dehydrogenase [Oceanobacillus limi]SET62068.1 shikimate dehydrogenase [Oceanobacillus limi]